MDKNITAKEWRIINKVIRSMFKGKPNCKPNPKEVIILKDYNKNHG